MKRVSSVVAVAIAGLVLGGCSSDASGAPEPGSTVAMFADYPSYDEQSLIKESNLIVEATVVSSEYTVVRPRFEGDAPEENPLLGLSEEEQKRAIEQDAGLPSTAVTLHIDAVYSGDAVPGREIVVIQTGGVVGGVEYRLEEEVPLEVGVRYLLFARDSFDGAFVILGGSAGSYLESDEGVFVPVNPAIAPFGRLTPELVKAYLTTP